MSGGDQGGEDKGFLARWSQRKHEAKQPKQDAPVAGAGLPQEHIAEGDAGQEFDLSSLPKLEEITSTTDITAFLRKGVPEHLRNAALRKSWALDSAIRNYVSPALEYAYDWNTPGGVPGSSEIGAGMDVARLVAQIMGGGESGSVEPSGSVAQPEREPATDPAPSPDHGATQDCGPDLPPEASRLGNETEKGTGIEAAPASAEIESAASQQAVRRHGSAKPVV